VRNILIVGVSRVLQNGPVDRFAWLTRRAWRGAGGTQTQAPAGFFLPCFGEGIQNLSFGLPAPRGVSMVRSQAPKGIPMNLTYLTPILLLTVSNVFMTFAWYGQLRFPATSLWVLIPVCWGIAFVEYCFAVPANHLGARVYSAAQLKTMQEIITLLVFAVFSVTYLGESLRWNQGVAFLFLCGAAFFSFHKWA
jgi:uncharacterized protein